MSFNVMDHSKTMWQLRGSCICSFPMSLIVPSMFKDYPMPTRRRSRRRCKNWRGNPWAAKAASSRLGQKKIKKYNFSSSFWLSMESHLSFSRPGLSKPFCTTPRPASVWGTAPRAEIVAEWPVLWMNKLWSTSLRSLYWPQNKISSWTQSRIRIVISSPHLHLFVHRCKGDSKSRRQPNFSK